MAIRRRATDQRAVDGGITDMLPALVKSKRYQNRYFTYFIAFLLILLFISYHVFTILRVSLRSRPAWLYGTPIPIEGLSECLLTSSTSTSTTRSNNNDHQVLFDWYKYSKSGIETPKVLIAQYSGFGDYAKFLNIISPVHIEYAKQKAYDYVILQGTMLDFPGIDQTCNPNPRATFDKIPLLEMAISDHYDYVLILDTDTLIVNEKTNLIDLIPSDQLLAAQRVYRFDWRNSWDINAGVTLWNLKHPLANTVMKRWKRLAQFGDDNQDSTSHRLEILSKNDDQYFLQTTLLDLGKQRPVWSLKDEFNYYKGTVVKHFKRDKRSWTTNGLEQRLERVQETINELCMQNTMYCQLQKSTIDFSKRLPPSGVPNQ